MLPLSREAGRKEVALRRTKIVATLGPASWSGSRISQLIRAGVDVFRLNFSHGTWEEHARMIQAVQKEAKAQGRAVAILQDLQGPRIRTGLLQEADSVELKTGEMVTLTTDPVPGTARRISIDYPRLPSVVRSGNRILLADGLLELRVEETRGHEVRARVVRGGSLGTHKGINLPEVQLPLSALTDKDRKDLEFGVSRGVDFVALSFVQRKEDLLQARALLRRLHSDTPVISKVEKAEAVEGLRGILAESGGVMVARGDLGVELGPERVPMLQKQIIHQANAAGVPVITATQMLESMIESPWPTRAEASDVANAILDGTDAVMLSGETAVGRYPVEAVETMVRIAEEVERTMRPEAHRDHPPESHAHSISHAATVLAEQVGAEALVVYSRSGYSAQVLSKERPAVPIYAFTGSEVTYRRLALWYGVIPFLSRFIEDTDSMIEYMQRELVRRVLVSQGSHVVILRLSPAAAQRRSNFVTVRTISRSRRLHSEGRGR